MKPVVCRESCRTGRSICRLLYTKKRCEQTCKPSSVLNNHLSRRAVAGALQRPTYRAATGSRFLCPFLVLLQVGFTRTHVVTDTPVSSYLAFSPLLLSQRLFSVTLLHSREWLPVRKYGALCCPDFPLASYERQTVLLYVTKIR